MGHTIIHQQAKGNPENSNILCVDVEEWYHAEYVKDKATGNKRERVTQNVCKTLHLLSEYGTDATFFIVGELAEKYPEIIEKIVESGSEIAFHGYGHFTLWNLTAAKFRTEVERYNSLVRSITRERCIGFRAPSYSMDNRTIWALDVLEELGYIYDASVFPMKTPLYGVSSAPIVPYHPSSENIAKQDENRMLVEFPALVYPTIGIRIPAAGGFYLRALPLFVLERAIEKMNRRGHPAVFSFHTWEIDPNTPRLRLGLVRSFVTYYNLDATDKKLRHLLLNFRFGSFRDYIEKHDV